MPTTNYNASDEHSFLLALAAVAAATSASSYTITLTSSFALAGTISASLPEEGETVAVIGNGNTLLGEYNLVVNGPGALTLDAASESAGGIYLHGGTLDIATPAAAGLGIISASNGTLRLDGAVLPTIPIQDFVTDNLTIDLTGVAAAATVVKEDAGNGLVIPAAGGGSVVVELSAAAAGTSFLLQPDGSGGTDILPTTLAVSGVVTVPGLGGTTLSISVAQPTAGPVAQAVVQPLDAGAGTTVVPFDISGGALPPTLPAGQTLELLTTVTGSYTLSGGNALVSTAPGVTTVVGGAGTSELVVGGAGGLHVTDGNAYDSVVALGGTNWIGLRPSSYSEYAVLAGGVSTVIAGATFSSVQTAGGSNLIVLGSGGDSVVSAASDTIVGTSGSDTINASHGQVGNTLLAFLGSGGTSFTGGPATTVVSGSGNDTIATFPGGHSLVALGAGTQSVSALGTDTILGGSGSATVSAQTALTFAGTGPMKFVGGGTVVGNAGGSLEIASNYYFFSNPVEVFVRGPTTFDGSLYSSTIVGAGAALNLSGSATYSYNSVLVGDPGGNNVIEGGSNCALIAGGNGDVLTATEAGVGFLAAGGAETLVGGGEDLYDFVNGRSGTITIQNFSKPTDQIVLSGFAVNAAGIALAGATTTGGSEQISLSDGTRITFQGITGLTAANFA